MMVYLLGNEAAWETVTEFMGLSVGTIIKKEKKGTKFLQFSLGLCCLVVLFLLLYVICVFLEQKTHGKTKKPTKTLEL